MPDIDASIEITPVKFWFQRPDGPSVDNEGNIYFNTWGCDEFANQVSCGVWKLEKGQDSVFFAVNSFEEGDLLDPFGTPYDEFEQSFIIAREVDKKDGERYFTPYTTVGRDIENNIIVIEIDRF